MQEEIVTLWTVGPFVITAWSLCLLAGAVAGILSAILIGRKRIGITSTLSICLASIVGAVLGGRFVYCFSTISDLLVNYGWQFIGKLWEGGYTLYGAVLGGICGVWVYSKVTRKPLGTLLDILAPGSALVLCAERAGEYFTAQGLGHYLDEESMQWFPLGVADQWETWQIPVFMYESIVALILFIVLLIVLRKAEPGRTAECFMVLLGVTQIFLESLREDEFIRFGFVRFTQLCAAFTLAFCLYRSVRLCLAEHRGKTWQIVRCVLFLLCVGGVIGLEFAFDKSSVDNRILYGIMACVQVLMGTVLLCRGRKQSA